MSERKKLMGEGKKFPAQFCGAGPTAFIPPAGTTSRSPQISNTLSKRKGYPRRGASPEDIIPTCSPILAP